MMPVPSHLRGAVIPLDSVLDEEALSATVRCSCGEDRFEFLYPGQTHLYQGKKIPCTAEIGGNWFFVIASRCVGCDHEHVLLDDDFHGWNGYVCHDPDKAALPRPSLVAWPCQDCGSTTHRCVVHIQTEGSEDFADAGDEFDPERWPDAFGWFSLHLTCANCGLESPGLVDYETM